MATARKYASGTTVAVDRTILEIQKLVKAHGAKSWRFEEIDDVTPTITRVTFSLHGWPLRFSVEAPKRSDFKVSPTGRYLTATQIETAMGQELRRRWREMAFLLKAKLVAIAAGTVDMKTEMLGYLIMEDGRTAGESLPPQIDGQQVASQRNLALLPPMIVEEEG